LCPLIVDSIKNTLSELRFVHIADKPITLTTEQASKLTDPEVEDDEEVIARVTDLTSYVELHMIS
jgi:hypothetical protein